MSDNKRYYWIKLKTDFFNQETIDFMLSQENGFQYVVLYQMLCLQAANNNGELSSKIGEIIIPYDAEKITRDTKHFNYDTVLVALDLFKKLGLIYEEENKILRISNFNEMVGSEVSSAKRVREFRERQKALQCNTNVTQEIEYRDKILDINIKEKDNNNKLLLSKKKKLAYGTFNNVKLTDEEYQKLKEQFSDYEEKIENMSYYLQSKGDKYKSHYATILNWARKEKQQPKNKTHAEEVEEMRERFRKIEEKENETN